MVSSGCEPVDFFRRQMLVFKKIHPPRGLPLALPGVGLQHVGQDWRGRDGKRGRERGSRQLWPQESLPHHIWWQRIQVGTMNWHPHVLRGCAPPPPRHAAGSRSTDRAFSFLLPPTQGLRENGAEAAWEKTKGDTDTARGEQQGMGGSKQQRKASAERALRPWPESLSMAGELPVALGGGAGR